jgi:ribonuclease HI
MAGVVVYADGGCSPNPGPGGWGAVIDSPGGRVEMRGGEPATTNNRMELTAAIRALEWLPAGAQVEMRCDSEYVVNSASKWMKGWKAKGWRSSTGDVKNVDLMKRLDALIGTRRVRWTWVRGHAGDPGNERADALVHQGRREAKAGIPETVEGPSPGAVGSPPTSAPQPATAGGAPSRTVPFELEAGLAGEMAGAAQAAGTTAEAFLADAVRVALALGLDGMARRAGKEAVR